MMPVRTDQIAVLVLFLLALGLLWFYAQRHRGALAGRLGGGRRLRVAEATMIGTADRAFILAVDGRDFLVLRMRGAAPVVVPLGSAAATGPVAETAGAAVAGS